ncbi:MAG: SDR family oxidoreductase [Dehalococcoidia bacterium]|nr:SDR family oxidoreductase [Dehalococcoidia bacterium]
MDIEGKIAVVTGAGSGIGKATAVALAKAGADLVLADVDEARLKETEVDIRDAGRKALPVRTDVSKLDDVRNLYEQSVRNMGRVDILMNNAGVHMSGPVERVSIEDWEWIVGINFWGVVYGIHVFLPHMLERGSGHIINTASIAGLGGWDGSIPYTATKFAVLGLSESLAIYLKGKGIGVTAVCPGLVATNISGASRFIPSGDEVLDGIRRGFMEAFQKKELGEIAQQAEILEPEVVAEQIVQAVRGETFLVTPHANTREMMVQRAQDPEGTINQIAFFRALRQQEMRARAEAQEKP